MLWKSEGSRRRSRSVSLWRSTSSSSAAGTAGRGLVAGSVYILRLWKDPRVHEVTTHQCVCGQTSVASDGRIVAARKAMRVIQPLRSWRRLMIDALVIMDTKCCLV